MQASSQARNKAARDSRDEALCLRRRAEEEQVQHARKIQELSGHISALRTELAKKEVLQQEACRLRTESMAQVTRLRQRTKELEAETANLKEQLTTAEAARDAAVSTAEIIYLERD